MVNDEQHANKSFIRYTWFVAFFVFVVIAAGGIVRMTQSGMGCPDWPTCFGRWIPPMNASELPADFEKYLRQQDIDTTFNPYHTWIEYLNRWAGALLGLFILVLVGWSFVKFFKKKPAIFWWSTSLLLLTGFQAWLGKKVVDANLAVVKITAHMLVALLIAAIPLYMIHLLRQQAEVKNKALKLLSLTTLAIVLVQIVLGTQVRQQIDEISRSLNYEQRNLWIERVNNIFIVHRSFSWIVVAVALFTFLRGYKIPATKQASWLLLSMAVLAFVLGIVLGYMNMPAIAQPLHLLSASLIAVTAYHLQLKVEM